MSSSSSSRREPGVFCLCGKVARLQTSWTDANSGRRCVDCAENARRFWNLFDPPMCARLKDIILGLLRKINRLEAATNREYVKPASDLHEKERYLKKMKKLEKENARLKQKNRYLLVLIAGYLYDLHLTPKLDEFLINCLLDEKFCGHYVPIAASNEVITDTTKAINSYFRKSFTIEYIRSGVGNLAKRHEVLTSLKVKAGVQYDAPKTSFIVQTRLGMQNNGRDKGVQIIDVEDYTPKHAPVSRLVPYPVRTDISRKKQPPHLAFYIGSSSKPRKQEHSIHSQTGSTDGSVNQLTYSTQSRADEVEPNSSSTACSATPMDFTPDWLWY
ncbi:tRNA uridine 5-carboxymethylaminomethyl modification enzyme MnmG [Striga asiatica]|uniref:tRNA uridine 5-carboxymethylaminomethyl modification enzyme MnmG n=1 Tax=Striga asiatica TaxID=4170 RepID=A0A5A7Q7J0_STRAF|nr:tRNA uridine 5-carboxymethylaminomethyl modification enzyme MnmG [Striga asiatica]